MKNSGLSPILNAIEAFESGSQRTGQLQTDRAKALDQYLGKPYGNEVEGRSQVVDRSISDTVEWIKPTLLRIFTSGEEIVQFAPQSSEDTDGAQQESDYVNYVMTQKNNWFTACYVWFTDALVQRNGYVKAWYERKQVSERESYKGLTGDQLAFLAKDTDVEIVEHNEYPDEYGMRARQQQLQQMAQQGQQLQMVLSQAAQQPQQQAEPSNGHPVPQQPNPQVQQLAQQLQQLTQQMQQLSQAPPLTLQDVVLRKKKEYACVKYMCLPPERCIVSVLHQDIDVEDAPFFEHWEWRTISDLRQEGYKVDDDISGEAGVTNDVEEFARNRFNENFAVDQEINDGPSKRVRAREVWIRFDHDEDGISELRHVLVVGTTILLNEEADLIPVAALTPMIMPHRHIGMSVSDAIEDLQLIKTTLLRGFLDNLYLANNGRYAINKDTVNLDDMLTSRPGGVVRVEGDPNGAVLPLVHQTNFAPVLQGMQYIDALREDRTGVNKNTQGIDGKMINQTASGTAQILSAAQSRIELIARVFAETGIKRLVSIIHSLTSKNADREEIVRLRNNWVPVDPRNWKTRFDMTVTVGLGTSNKQELLQHLIAVYQQQKEMLPMGLSNPDTIYHTLKKITINTGFKDVDSFWIDPKGKPFQPPPSPDIIKIQVEGKLEEKKISQHDQHQRMKLLLDKQIADQEVAVRKYEIDRRAEGEHTKFAIADTDAMLARESLLVKHKEHTENLVQADKHKAADLAAAAATAGGGETAEGEQKVTGEQSMAMAIEGLNAALAEMRRPRKIVRGQNGLVEGIE